MILLRDVAATENCTISSRQSLAAAIAIIAANKAGAVVIDDSDRPVGILTERDVVRLLDADTSRDTPLDAFRKPLVCAQGERTLIFAVNIMLDRNIRRIVVVDAQGRFAGIVSQDEIVRHLEDEIYYGQAKVFHVLYNRRALLTLPPDARLADAVSMMAKHDVGSVVVLDRGAAVGILTEKDVVRLESLGTDRSTRLDSVMSQPVISSPLDASVRDVLRVLRERRIRRVVVCDGDGNALGIITSRDLLRNAEGSYSEFLKHKLHHAREILDALPEIVMEVIDADGESLIQWCNKKTVQEFSRNPVDQPVTSLIAPDEWSPIRTALIETGKVEKHRLRIHDRTYELAGSCMKLHRENVLQFILRDVTDELRRSTTDFLTDLHNRRKFEEIFDGELVRVSRYARPLSLLIFDIDSFKSVNDTYGHAQGDHVLREVARIVKHVVRSMDALGRYGGDEFVILCPELPMSAALTLAERVRKRVDEHEFEGVEGVTISVGVAGYVAGDTRETLTARADASLYRAKDAGRNRVGSIEPA